MTRFIYVLFLVLITHLAQARTWHVQKDGSGDYTIIQDAVDVAASGDTISIGPGRFDEYTTVDLGLQYLVRILVEQQELTIVGSRNGQTTVGPAQLGNPESGVAAGIRNEQENTTNVLRVSNMHFENLQEGISYWSGLEVSIVDCSFLGNIFSIYLAGAGAGVVERCVFEQVAENGRHVTTNGQTSFNMNDCTASHDNTTQWSTAALGNHGTDFAHFNNCEFYGGAIGLFATEDGESVVTNCVFRGQTTAGVHLDFSSPTCQIEDSSFFDQRIAFSSVYAEAEWRIERTKIENVSEATLIVGEGGARGYIIDCILNQGAQYVVCSLYPDKADQTPVHFDMTNNWWGTADPDSIQDRILDWHDNPELKYIIDFEPYLLEPVSNENTTMGDLKALFR